MCVHGHSRGKLAIRPRSLRVIYLAHRLRYSKPSEDFIFTRAYFARSSINYTTSRSVPLLNAWKESMPSLRKNYSERDKPTS